MPSPPETIDERFEELVEALRAAKPAASDDLRGRVALTASTAPPRRRFDSRRVLPLIAVAGTVAAGAIAAAVSLDARDGERVAGTGGGAERAETVRQLAPVSRARKAPLDVRRAAPANAQTYSDAEEAGALAGGAADAGTTMAQTARGAALRPSRRLQDYRTFLRVHVRDVGDLSNATARAMRTTRSLGGFVVSARYVTPIGGEGDSLLVVRVPIGRVQEAIARFSALGDILAQRIQIDDLQQTFNRRGRTIASISATIDRLERRLRTEELSFDERMQIRYQLDSSRAQLRELRRAQRETVARGRLARISLTLTTREPAEVAPAKPRGELEQTLRDAVGASAQILVWLLAGVILAAPFLLLAAAVVVATRRWRRYAAERLLERPSP